MGGIREVSRGMGAVGGCPLGLSVDDFVFVVEVIAAGFYVGNAAVVAPVDKRAFRRLRTDVFHDAAQAAFGVADTEHRARNDFALQADDPLVLILHPGAGQNAFAGRRGKAGIAEGYPITARSTGRIDALLSAVQSVSGIGNENRRLVGVQQHVIAAVGLGLEVVGGVVLLVAQLADGGVKRQNCLVAGVVGEDLGLVIALGIPVDAQARGPVVVPQVLHDCTGIPLLFPAEAEADVEVASHLPGIVAPGHVIVRGSKNAQALVGAACIPQ